MSDAAHPDSRDSVHLQIKTSVMQSFCIRKKNYMPANLNALIRYKTIDRLLGTGRKYALSELIEYCSEDLGESRGIYKTISKRTIQEDIRILRSDILGFNAPIKNSFGKYYYEEVNFSIFNTSISNINILKRVYDFLLSIKDDEGDGRLDNLLVELSGLIPEEKPSVFESQEDAMLEPSYLLFEDEPEDYKELPVKKSQINAELTETKIRMRRGELASFSWGRLLEFIA